LQPAELPAFPFGAPVPPDTEIEILGLFGMPCIKPNGAGRTARTLRMKVIHNRKTLFTKQEDGFLFERSGADVSYYVYTYSNSQIGFGAQREIDMPFIFPTPRIFKAGEELGVYVYYKEETVTTGGTAIYGGERIGVIERIRRIG
jgi:hypothetical protein